MRHFVLGAILLAGSAAQAADLGAKKPRAPAAPAVSAACKETKGLPADAFGFASGSDVADLGAWGAALDTTATRGVRGGSGYTLAPTVQLSGSFLPCLEVGPYAFFGYTHFKPYGGGASTKTSVFGGGIELKYKLLGRAPHGIGLTFAVSPNFSGSDTSPGASFGQFGNSYRLLADMELIKDKLYGAFNIELFQTLPTNTLAAANSAVFALRGALTTPVTDALYLGAEASYQRAYAGAWLNRYLSSAVYVGPTFFWQINDKFTLNGTWAYQVAGDSRLSPGRVLGIDSFSRHLVRVKLGYSF
jgi:hypothetical protein